MIDFLARNRLESYKSGLELLENGGLDKIGNMYDESIAYFDVESVKEFIKSRIALAKLKIKENQNKVNNIPEIEKE